MDERRKYPRLDTRIRVEVEYHKEDLGVSKKGTGESLDLARGGVAFHYDEVIPEGSYVIVNCHLPGEDGRAAFFGRVVRNIVEKGAPPVVCVKFLRYEKEDLAKLKDYLTDFFPFNGDTST